MKSRRKIQCLTLCLISIVSFSELSLVALAQIKPAKLPFNQQSGKIQQLAQNQPTKPQQTPIPQQKKKRSTLAAILSLFKDRKGLRLGSRGVCLVSPGILEQEDIIWSDRPLFLWQGVGLPQEIRLYSPFNSKQEEEVIWRQNLNQLSPEITFQGVQYTGQPLEAGKRYDWEIFNQSSKSQERRSFQVMEIKERDRISAELQQLEAKLRVEQATDEEIAIERANYFAQQNLWSDALQEMFSIKNPSPESIQTRQNTLKELCSRTDTEINSSRE